MFGSSFASSLPPSSAAPPSSSSSSSGGKKSAFGSSTTSSSPSSSTTTGGATSLPFAGFGGGFGGAGSKTKRSAESSGFSGGNFSGGNGGNDVNSNSPFLKHNNNDNNAKATTALSSQTAPMASGAASSISMSSSGTSFGTNMFAAGGGGIPKKGSKTTGSTSPSTGMSFGGGFGGIPKTSTTSVKSSPSPGLPFAGFSGGGGSGGMSQPPKSAFSGAASAAAAAASGGSSGNVALALVRNDPPSTRTTASTTSAATARTTTTTVSTTAITHNNAISTNNKNDNNKNDSVENSCMSPDGRSFHSYLYDPSLERHLIVSEFAPFGDAAASANAGTGTPRNADGNDSSLKITTVLPSTIGESINIDPVIGLICVDGSDGDDNSARSSKKRLRHHQQQQQQRRRMEDGGRGEVTSSLPWMCLYTRTCAYLLSIGYPDGDDDNEYTEQQQTQRNGKILHVLEPFEKQLLMSPRGSSVLRIRAAPTCDSVFQRCGSMALLLREGGEGEDDEDDAAVVGHVMLLYHGLPESILLSGDGPPRGGAAGRGRDFGGNNNPASEGSVTVPLRFDREDLVRGKEDTVDAENEAYASSTSSLRDRAPTSPSSSSLHTTKRVVDFCFLRPNMTASSGSGGGLFSATSVFVLCNDGSVYGASPILFDGTVLPRSIVVNAISHLDGEIEASSSILTSMATSSPAPTLEQERLDARSRQCRAARRYLLDAFGIPEGTIPRDVGSEVAAPTMTPSRVPAVQGSYYVSASVVHSRLHSSATDDGRFSRALEWQTRLQGPLVGPSADSTPCLCIESFGSVAGAGIIDAFAVVRDCRADGRSHASPESPPPIHVEFGILPGGGAVVLPRFEFESDIDCQLIDDLIHDTGMYVERALIMDDNNSAVKTDGLGGRTSPRRTLPVSASSVGRHCSIVADPLDDIMVHVMTRSRIVTVTTNAIVLTANCVKSRVSGEATNMGENNHGMSGIRTKVWSGLEVNSSDTTLVGACVSGDVHLGHVMLAKVSNGSMEVVNITAAQCLHETSEQMKVKSEQLDAADGDQKALEILLRVKPLPELLQPLIDKVCDGLSKMGKIVGGATLPKDAGPETLAVFIDTQQSCEKNILLPMEEMSKILATRRHLLQEMYEHQAAELVRLTTLLSEFKKKYESNVKRVVELESNASVLAERSSAVLTATRELGPQITDAESAYFQDLRRYETSCNKWDGTVNKLQNEATSSCDAMSAGAIENGDVQCLVDLPPQKIAVCHKLLRGEGQMLKQLERKVKESSAVVNRISNTISGLDSADAARLRLIGGDKENQRR